MNKQHPIHVIRVEQAKGILDMWFVVERDTTKRGLRKGFDHACIMAGHRNKPAAISIAQSLKRGLNFN